MNDHFGDLFRIIKNTDVTERMGVFDMLDMVRENTWKAGIEQKENRLEKVKFLARDFVKWVLITDKLLFWDCLFCGHGQLLAKNQFYCFLTTQVELGLRYETNSCRQSLKRETKNLLL